jgi:hypothetical protein
MRAFLFSLVVACGATGGSLAGDEADLFGGYDGKEPVPDGLRKAYTAFARQTKEGAVESYLLPHAAVAITRQARPEKEREYGRDMNLPFLRNGFSSDVRSLRKDPDDCYLVRTGTSAIWFVQTKSGAWKIYSYLDKPIE